ncbi:TrkH family potassium uptake protein [Ehrlichia minasensis]|uniref:TrkH family potassium uptake protein n=1 Tax=Ehrlichia minasensis TaxID=1242993 RepID=UPI000A8B431A|nr:TrkH family potassium uptake protein [Ehrlichia minasensis]
MGRPSNLKQMNVVIVTVIIWIVLSVISAIPFIYDCDLHYIDAFFESVSGLTTTGATILTDLQNQSPGILIWRALLNAIGGLGIITSGIFLLSYLKIYNLHGLYRSESSEQSKKFKYGIVRSSMYIFIIYCMLMASCTILYWISGMSGFDAICHAMSTVSTGGFSNYDNSLQHFNNVYIEVIAVIFMLLSSCPFMVYLKIITKQCFYDEQIVFFAIIVFLFVMISVINCYFDETMSGYSFLDILRYSVFSVVSLSTSTGLVNCDYTNWHFFSIFGILMMLIGGCSGSTNSGIKVYRIVLLVKALHAYMSNIVYPTQISTVKYNRKCVSEDFICNIGLFFSLYIFLLFIGSAIVSSSGVDFITAFSAVSGTFSNVGPGMGHVIGPSANYYNLLPSVKILLSFFMLMGRLEIIPFFSCMYLMANVLLKNR